MSADTIAAGEYGSTGVDLSVVKLGPKGRLRWQRAYIAPWKEENTGYSGRSPGCIRQTMDGRYVVIGFVPGQQSRGDRNIRGARKRPDSAGGVDLDDRTGSP